MSEHSPLRITIVEPLGTGGMIHYAYQLGSALSDAGARVTLLTSSAYELTTLPHNFQVDRALSLWPHHDPSRARAHHSAFGRTTRKAAHAARRAFRAVLLLRAWLVLLRRLRPGQTDVLQFGTLRFPFEGVFLSILKRRGFVLADVCHEPELRERPQGWIHRLSAIGAGMAYESFDAVFLHGTYNADRFRRLHPEAHQRTFEIEHGNEHIFRLLSVGIDRRTCLRARYGLADDDVVVLFFGHLVPSKGVEDLVRAHAALPRGWRLVIAGYPSKLFDVGALESLIRDLDLQASVVLDLRYIPGADVAALMGLATVVVLPYRSASQSGALQVAYTFGKPVVATRAGGLPEVIDDGRSGLLVSPESPDELARALESIVSSPERAARMGAQGRHLAETRFSWDGVAADILAVYARLVRAKAG